MIDIKHIDKDYLKVGDSSILLRELPDECIDLTITSPPYDNLRKYNGYSFDFENIANELYRVTVNGGCLVWIVSDQTIDGSETGTSFKQALYFKQCGFKIHDTMIFQKQNPIPQIFRKRYRNEFEYMFVFAKGTIKTCNPIMEKCLHAGLKLSGTTYKNYSPTTQNRTKKANPVKEEKIKGNIWSYVVGKKKEDQDAKKHPAPFPLQLAKDHIYSWSNEGDVVLDPFIGSGTTAIASLSLNRHYIGFDISDEYISMAQNRIEDYIKEVDNS